MINEVILQDVKEIGKRLRKTIFPLQGKTLLISGGAGFLGTYLIETIKYFNKNFFSRPTTVICLDNYITSEDNRFIKTSKNIQYIKGDVSKPLHMRRKFDYIIHAAGIASPIYYKKYPLQAIEVNTQGTKNLLELAVKNSVKSFLYFSSSEIYGDPDTKHIPTSEEYRGNVSCNGPRACYDESKRLGEALAVNYYDVHKTPVKIVRPFNIYGPGMRPEDYRVIPAFLYRALTRKPLEVHDTGQQTRTYCYISDAIVAFYKVLMIGKNRGVYNVGNNTPEITTQNLAKRVAKLFPKSMVRMKLIPYPTKYPQDVPQRRCPDLTKIMNQLHYKPLINLDTGLARTLEWYKLTYF